ncbi:C45 family autoproteolytic acyltransferase/hydolase [Chelatococcus asaccharovorans]|uniref:C45 family autoproteolytic acyltransferase/hydolase n=1 Tax=Chelatococcus asaccharovorans TaxID=28210 RepID=UPI00224C6C29|nr:C45 family peptidase [Chelatococcus asaccharovorans]CAH1658206.1 Acyl-coenzyme A:6-aminopenicillanic acid acyl-transferase [Chelatococcus asaccharovorans]CAH1688791.1 Acyl-coenzyme A:6-aminopenicillanic acid acyl-transferase [Chelatococcus asaccharovorans]
MTAFPLVVMEGGSRDRGLQYGRAAGQCIHRGLALYRGEFERRGISWPQVEKICSQASEHIARYDPAIAIEIDAIAEGAELPVTAILAINARTEVINARHYRKQPAPAECSGIVALPEVTRDGTVLHGQNWDWLDAAADSTVVLHIRDEYGHEILGLAEAGQVARCGMNSAGLALTANGLHTDREGETEGVCSPVIRRNVLRQKTLGEAIGVIMQSPRNYSHNFMLSHRDGMAIDLETTPSDVFWLKPRDGLLIHTNHFTSPAALASAVDEGVRRSPDSLVREMLIEGTLSRRNGPIDPQTIMAAFMDSTDAPYGVLQPPKSEKTGVMESTVATIIMEPARGRMWVSRQPYLAQDFTEYAFS